MEVRKILYISYDGMTDPLGQSQVIPYLIGLANKGHKITLLSFEKKNRLVNSKYEVSEILNYGGIDWVPLIYHSKPPLFSTVYDVYKMWQRAKQLEKQKKIDIVHCRSYISALIGLKLKRDYGVKFVFDMRGFWADERVEGGLWDLKKPIFKLAYNYFKKREIAFLKESDYVISLTKNAKTELVGWDNMEIKDKIKVIPCCVDVTIFTQSIEKGHTLKNKLGLANNEFVLTYLGSIGTWYMLEEMLDFFKILAKEKPSAKFLFVTTENKDVIIRIANRKNIPIESIIIKSVKREEVPQYLEITDLSIFFIRPTYSKKASSPTKMGELLSMGVPIICNTGVGDVDIILNQNNAGILVKEFTNKAYLNAIKSFENKIFSNLHKVAIDNFSLENGVQAYDEVYQSV